MEGICSMRVTATCWLTASLPIVSANAHMTCMLQPLFTSDAAPFFPKKSPGLTAAHEACGLITLQDLEHSGLRIQTEDKFVQPRIPEQRPHLGGC